MDRDGFTLLAMGFTGKKPYWGAAFVEFLAEWHNTGTARIIGSQRGKGGSTFGHWQIGIAYAKYLSPEFHMWCNAVVRERMQGKAVSAPASLSPEVAAMIELYFGSNTLPSTQLTCAEIGTRDKGEMLSLTDMWKASGADPSKRPYEWSRKEGATFVEAVSLSLNAPVECIYKAERGKGGPTFAHWQIAIVQTGSSLVARPDTLSLG